MATEVVEALHQILIGLQTTIAAAESMTCGEVQTHLGTVPGSSNYFVGGMTAYNIENKVEHLGVDARHALEVNCVSDRVAREMAAGIRMLLNAEIGISTTGYAMPDEEHEVEAPFAWIGFNLFDTSFEQRVEPEGGFISMSSPEDRRVEAQGDVGYKAVEILLEWFRGVHAGTVEVPENTRALLEARGFFDMEMPEYDLMEMGEKYGYH